MKFRNSLRNKQFDSGDLLLMAMIAVLVLALNFGCTTVTPRMVQSPSASWDGTNQNSGFIGWSGNNGIITPHARDRYNALIDVYGKKFVPALVTDYGITATSSNVFVITPEALSDFALMNRWRKSEAK